MTFRRAWRAFKWSLLARHDRYPDFEIDRRLLRQERMTPPELAIVRREKTRALVRACLDHIPYYGDLMRDARLDPDAVEGPEDLEGLPLLTKEMVRREKGRMLHRQAAPEEYHPHSTSGSTGLSLDFFRGYDYERIAVAAANLRAWRRMGWRPGDPLARFWGAHGDVLPPAGGVGRVKRRLRRWLEPPEETFDPFDVAPRILEQWVSRLRAHGPDFYYGYTSVLTLLGLHLRHRGETLARVRGIGTTAEALLPHARAAFKEVFPRAAVIDIYGSREVPGVSAECRLGAMHINSDLVHVEFVADPLAQGGSRVVLTALDNRIFPFIRYDIGDEGSPSGRPCPCGLPFPTMRFGPGRIVDFFVMPDGRILYAGSLEDLMYDVPDVHRYQFLQKTATEVVLSVVPDTTFGAAGRDALERARLKAMGIFGPAVSLEVRLVDAIPLSRSGKHLYLVSRVRNPILGGTETATL